MLPFTYRRHRLSWLVERNQEVGLSDLGFYVYEADPVRTWWTERKAHRHVELLNKGYGIVPPPVRPLIGRDLDGPQQNSNPGDRPDG